MKKKNLYIVWACLFCFICFSQDKDIKKINKGDKLYNDKAYFKCIEIYEKVANDGYKSVELFEKLGDSYFFNAEYVKANKWYTELFKLPEVDLIYYYRYSQTLKSVGDNSKAAEYLKMFSDLNNSDARSMQYINNINYLSDIKNNTKHYIVKDAGINSSFSDYGTSIINDKLVFASSRTREGLKSKKDDWTADYFSALYSASLSGDYTLSKVELFAKEIQTKYHEADPVFTTDGKTMFFTRNNEKKKKSKTDKTILLKIYKATLENDKWSNIVELPFNSEAYSCAHPSLSPDGKLLYFASDMPGGLGESDIYKIDLDETYNSVGSPVNLGKNINTQGKETFPWVSYDNKLYFASDGHLGLGGLDIFVTEINSNFSAQIINIGQPVNSEFDDFYFVQLKNSKTGFFTSNREGGKGKDDIYRFTEQREPLSANGQVIDSQTQQPIPSALVTIYDQKHEAVVSTTNADSVGSFLASIDAEKNAVFYVKAESADYETKEIDVDLNKIDLKKGLVIGLDKKEKKLDEGIDLAKELNIKEILFDLDRSDIRPDAIVELQKIIQVMSDFPNIKISIGSHTDSRQTYKYNMLLSEKRAKSTMDFLISKGISGSRLTAQGYGESKLLNKCSDGVECSEEEHQMNRRSEFTIVNKL